MTKWLRFLRFYVFLKIQEHDFLRFLRGCTRFLEHWPSLTASVRRPKRKHISSLLHTGDYSRRFRPL